MTAMWPPYVPDCDALIDDKAGTEDSNVNLPWWGALFLTVVTATVMVFMPVLRFTTLEPATTRFRAERVSHPTTI